MYRQSNNKYFRQSLVENNNSKYLNQKVNINSNPAFSNLTLNQCWDDLLVSASTFTVASSIRPPASTKIADIAGGSANGVYGWSFEEGKSQDVMCSTQLSHKYKLGSTLYPHIHISVPTNEALKYIQFSLEYFVVSLGSAYTDSVIITTAPLLCPAAKTHVLLQFPNIVGTGLGISSIFYSRLTRDTIANDYTGIVNLLSFDIHIEMDSLGSHTEYLK